MEKEDRMRTLTLSMTVIVLACACSSSTVQPTPMSSASASTVTVVTPLACNDVYWKSTYDPIRLIVLSICELEIGFVTFVEREHDGDLEMHLIVPTDRLLGPGNFYLDNGRGNPRDCGPSGCLMVEIPCQGGIDQANAVGTCTSFISNGGHVFPDSELPQIGQCIRAAAHWVEDTGHKHTPDARGWFELHGAVFEIVACPADLLEKVAKI